MQFGTVLRLDRWTLLHFLFLQWRQWEMCAKLWQQHAPCCMYLFCGMACLPFCVPVYYGSSTGIFPVLCLCLLVCPSLPLPSLILFFHSNALFLNMKNNMPVQQQQQLCVHFARAFSVSLTSGVSLTSLASLSPCQNWQWWQQAGTVAAAAAAMAVAV